jgi:hypothetical protein
MSHFDKLVGLPKDFVVIASSQNSEWAGVAHQTKQIYGECSLAHCLASVCGHAKMF